jgi:hypothetical protein
LVKGEREIERRRGAIEGEGRKVRGRNERGKSNISLLPSGKTQKRILRALWR